MADVSVRFPIGNDGEVVLNLSVPRALQLIETISRAAAGMVTRPASDLGGGSQPPRDVASAWPGR